MRILFYSPDSEADIWIKGFAEILPEAQLHFWKEGETLANSEPADYAVVWRPPMAMLQGRTDVRGGVQSRCWGLMPCLNLAMPCRKCLSCV